MKAIFLSTFIFLGVQSWAEDCENIAGSYKGICVETMEDGSKNNYEIKYNIRQNGCETVEIDDLEQGYVVSFSYNVKGGLTTIEESQGYKVVTGGTFGTESGAFAATTLFINPDGNVDPILGEFKKMANGALKVTQTATGSRMTCELPAVSP